MYLSCILVLLNQGKTHDRHSRLSVAKKFLEEDRRRRDLHPLPDSLRLETNDVRGHEEEKGREEGL